MSSTKNQDCDERFLRVQKDPRFWEMPERERKVKIDKRFQSMFHDKRFKVKYTVDKRGRPINHTSTEDLKRFYKMSDSDEDEEEEDVKGRKVAEKKKQKQKVKMAGVDVKAKEEQPERGVRVVREGEKFDPFTPQRRGRSFWGTRVNHVMNWTPGLKTAESSSTPVRFQ